MTWRSPDTYHLAGHGRGTATLKFYEGRDILGGVGSRRTFGPGDLLRAKATEGTGHVTRPVGDPPVEALFLSG